MSLFLLLYKNEKINLTDPKLVCRSELTKTISIPIAFPKQCSLIELHMAIVWLLCEIFKAPAPMVRGPIVFSLNGS